MFLLMGRNPCYCSNLESGLNVLIAEQVLILILSSCCYLLAHNPIYPISLINVINNIIRATQCGSTWYVT